MYLWSQAQAAAVVTLQAAVVLAVYRFIRLSLSSDRKILQSVVEELVTLTTSQQALKVHLEQIQLSQV
jgi:hypothetical protein